ncbi:MAG: hypothetical protein Q4G25_07745 [Paracoccus sp. (in: a-proteobacteria)]|nr:hypothetical protein [Paracoccus sp. (in: a-proteobacteria)]
MTADLLLLGGIALCALSVIAAIVQLIRTEAPRGAAILLVLGIAAMAGSAALGGTDRLGPAGICAAWDRVTGKTAP